MQVVNFSQDDVWLSPKVKLGVLGPCQSVDRSPCHVRFQHVVADHEEVIVKPGVTVGTDREGAIVFTEVAHCWNIRAANKAKITSVKVW